MFSSDVAVKESSQDMRRSRGRQPQTLGNAQPRHRSESRRLSDRQRPVKTTARKPDHCLGALREGEPVQVFSRSSDKWVEGEVVELMAEHFVRVEYEVGVDWCGKIMHIHSENLFIPTAITDPSVGALAFESSEEEEEHDPGQQFDKHRQVQAWSFSEQASLNAHIILTDGKGKIFLIRNASHGVWGYPGGVAKECDKKKGSLEPFETMKREFEKKTGTELPRLTKCEKLSGNGARGFNNVIYVAHANWKDLIPHIPNDGTLDGDGENDQWQIVQVEHLLQHGHWEAKGKDKIEIRSGHYDAIEEANNNNLFD